MYLTLSKINTNCMLSDYKDLFKYLNYLYTQCIYTKKQLHHALKYFSANECIFIGLTETPYQKVII